MIPNGTILTPEYQNYYMLKLMMIMIEIQALSINLSYYASVDIRGKEYSNTYAIFNSLKFRYERLIEEMSEGHLI